MNEILVDGGKVVAAMIHGVEQLLAHAHQRRGTAGGEIEPAEQFETARLGGVIELGAVASDGAAAKRRRPYRCRPLSCPKVVASVSKKAMRGPVVNSA